jgi:glycosyltransferase involved in cell wall biosynthesis
MRQPSGNASDMSRIWTKIRGFFSGLDKINENLYVFTPLVLPLPSSKFVQTVNRILLEIYLRTLMLRLGMKNVQIWTFVPNMVNLIGRLCESKVVYYCVDEWSEFSFLDKKTVESLERSLLSKSDLVITTAQKLYESKKRHNTNTYLIPHGVDFDFFAKALAPSTVEPLDIQRLPKPRIGFFGLIHEWIDLNLIHYMAKAHPEWSIVLIGKLATGIDVSRFASIHNVHFIGQKDYSELPGYCKGFDVALIPFVLNELTLNVNPIKLREYLAAGLPVVSTALPEIFPYHDVVHIADSMIDFTREVERALLETGSEWIKKRQASVAEESWRARVERISGLIE